MGVPVGEADGDHVATLVCRNCDTRYETDETMYNSCPEGGLTTYDFADEVDDE